MTPQTGAIEAVLFKAKTQFTDEQVIQMLTSLNPLLQGFPGFISRQLSKDESGQWLDLVYWESMEQARQAADQVMQMEEATHAFGVIDERNMSMYHFTPAVAAFVPAPVNSGTAI
jgi:heme-degrading monooxygenase HmoA